MLLLALDTAGPNCAVALAREGPAERLVILASTAERMGRGHSERLMPMIEATLAHAGIFFADLDRIAVTTGPGSFTGVRVGIAAARALALSLGLGAVGIGSLAALLADILEENTKGTAVAVLDARRNEVYVRVQDIATAVVLVEAAAMGVDELKAMLNKTAPPLILSGGAAPMIAGVLADADTRIAGTLEAPEIAAVAVLGISAEAVSPPVPIYARGADAKPHFGRATLHA